MSTENLIERAEIAREKYSFLVSNLGGEEGKHRPQILNEIQSIIVIRGDNHPWPKISCLRIDQKLRGSAFLMDVRAAVFFLDKPFSKVICGQNMSDTQADIYGANSKLLSKTRISGEIVTLNIDDETKYFLCYPVLLRQSLAHSVIRKNRLTEIAESLLDNGYIPVDAKFNILPITTPNP